jgi:iron(III) transport system permease protein
VNDPFTFSHWTRVLGDPALGRSFRNTILIGLGAGCIGVLVYSLIAYVVIRTQTIGRRAIDVVAWLPWSIPGVLLGLALLWTFLGNPALRFFYGTIGILILAIIIREMPLGVQLMKAAIQQVSAELEESARVSGASWFRTYRKILLPLISPTALAVGLLTFVVSARDISTLVLLARQDSRPMSLLMLEYATGAETERAAAVGIMVSFIVIGLALLTRRFRTELR